MALLKKLVLALFVSVAMLATAPSAIAKPAGKIENQTPAGVLPPLTLRLQLLKKHKLQWNPAKIKIQF